MHPFMDWVPMGLKVRGQSGQEAGEVQESEQNEPGEPEQEVPAPKRRYRDRANDGAKSGKLVRVGKLMNRRERARLEATRAALDAEVASWQAGIVADLGGDLSAQQRAVLGLAAAKFRVSLILGNWIAQRPTRILDARAGTVRPIVLSFMRSSESVEKSLTLLGLNRVARQQSLSTYLVARAAQEAESEAPEAPVIEAQVVVNEAPAGAQGDEPEPVPVVPSQQLPEASKGGSKVLFEL